MRLKIQKMAASLKEAVSSAATLVGDLNGDGKVDEEDARIAAEWTKKQAKSVGSEALRIGKEAVRSDLAKDAAAGAAVGAVIAVPVPVIGPMAGAAIGAGVGVYKNITKKQASPPQPQLLSDKSAGHLDVHAQLLKLDELRQKGILTDEEFRTQKQRLLGSA